MKPANIITFIFAAALVFATLLAIGCRQPDIHPADWPPVAHTIERPEVEAIGAPDAP